METQTPSCCICGKPMRHSRSETPKCLECRRQTPSPQTVRTYASKARMVALAGGNQTWDCEHCGKRCERRPVKGTLPKWCGPKCATSARVDRLGDRECAWCGRAFTPTDPRGLYCSRSCSSFAGGAKRAKLKQVKSVPIKIDQRSEIRKALEDGRPDEVASALRRRSRQVGECWDWLGKLDRNGYPVMSWSGRMVYVHRAVIEAVCGAPLGVQHAHHTCGNSRCVNPDHLQPVTHRDNIAEMLARSSYVARIRELEAALAELAPHHQLLDRVPLAG